MRLVARAVCAVRGHDFGPVVYVSPSVLIHCLRCGRELQGRTVADLAPMTDEDWDFLESLDGLDES